MAPTLFGIFFTLLLKNAFGNATERIICTQERTWSFLIYHDKMLKLKFQEKLIREMLCRWRCRRGALTRWTAGLDGQICNRMHCFWTDHQHQEDWSHGTEYRLYLFGLTISSTLGLDKEIDRHIGRACGTFAKLR